MELTDGQKKGLEIACQRYKENKPYTVIAGFGGTGKSFLVCHIIKELKLKDNEVVFIAFTGKAALVLKEKGNKNTMTAHKLLYHSEEQADGTYIHTPKTKLDHKYKLIVVDEASMLPQEMIDLLLSHHVYTIFLGDPAQLPPISGEQTILSNPHVFLDEIVRQARDNPIIKLSMDIRHGMKLHYTAEDKRCRVLPRSKVSDKMLLGADQILCGKNKTRHELNDYMRRLILGNNYGNEPVNGDKVICLKNHWNTVNSVGNELVNGTIGELYNISIKEVPPYGQVIYANFISDDGGIYRNLMIDYNLIVNGQPTINSENWKKFSGYPKPFEFAFGYVITCHKAEGSEFNRVVVFEEWLGDYESHKRWLYTAATRASEQLVIVM
nr:MAG TPA: exodeoxyribonuclease V [Caudoviricetes sp.]